MPEKLRPGELYSFGGFRLDPHRSVLTQNGERIPLTPRAAQTLVALIQNAGVVVSKDELMRYVWGTLVDENNLNQSIRAIRKALGDSPKQSRYLVTVPGTGYRFVGLVKVEPEHAAPAPAPVPEQAVNKAPAATTRVQGWWTAGSVAVLLLVGGVLWRPSSAPPSEGATIAVLPFEDVSARPDQALVDGFAEEIARRLSRVAPLRVVAHTSSFQFRNRPVDAVAAGRKLGAQFLIDGRLAVAGTTVTLDARIRHTSDGAEIWTRRYQQLNLAATESALARDLAGHFTAQVLRRGLEPIIRREAGVNPEAHDLMLRGRYAWYQRSWDEVRKSASLLDKAVALAPDYALAQAYLADSYGLIASWRIGPIAESIDRAEKAALKSIQLDPGLAEGYGALGLIENSRWEWDKAEAHLKHALELNSGFAPAYQRLAYNYTVRRRFAEAEALLKAAQTLDPLQWFLEVNLGELHFYWGHYDQALAHVRRIEELQGRNFSYYNLLARIYFRQGRKQELKQLCVEPGAREESLCQTLGLDLPRQLAVVDKAGGPAELMARAQLCTEAGDRECAFQALEKGFAERNPDLVSLGLEPVFERLKGDSRYQSLMKRMGLAP